MHRERHEAAAVTAVVGVACWNTLFRAVGSIPSREGCHTVDLLRPLKRERRREG